MRRASGLRQGTSSVPVPVLLQEAPVNIARRTGNGAASRPAGAGAPDLLCGRPHELQARRPGRSVAESIACRENLGCRVTESRHTSCKPRDPGDPSRSLSHTE